MNQDFQLQVNCQISLLKFDSTSGTIRLYKEFIYTDVYSESKMLKSQNHSPPLQAAAGRSACMLPHRQAAVSIPA